MGIRESIIQTGRNPARARLSLCACLLVGVSLAQLGSAALPAPSDQMLAEQKHFLESLAYVYSPPLWFSYHDAVYFRAFTVAQTRQLESLKAARGKYVALTDRRVRHALAASLLTETGLATTWQRKLLLPYSETNPDLTPTLNRQVRLLSASKLLRNLGDGDAVLADGATPLFVMDFPAATDPAALTNAVLIKEGTKTLTTTSGQKQTLEAFTWASLSPEASDALKRASAAFAQEAARLGRELAHSKERQEFEELKARASDSNPFMQFLVAQAYLDGKGTATNSAQALEWMRRAAKNGSGDAQTYLDRVAASAR